MRITHLGLLALIPAAMAQDFFLTARQTNTNKKVELGAYNYDLETGSISVVNSTANAVPIEGAYCVDAFFNGEIRDFLCFSFLELQNPLHYSLVLDLHDDEITKLSLEYNPEADGITPLIRRPEPAPEAPAIKLKKVTKTYRDKKAAQNKATAQYEDSEEVDTRSWIQKNWKMLVIGLVAYNLIAFTSRQQQRQE